MKVHLSQHDVFQAIQMSFEAKGMTVPDESEVSMEVVVDEAGGVGVGVEVDFSTIAVKKTAAVVVNEQADPVGDAPPILPEDEFEVVAESMGNFRSQSAALAAKGPPKYTPTRDKFKKTRVASTIAGLGKDPADMKDEIA